MDKPKGPTELWGFEFGTVGGLSRAGFRPSDFATGTKVTVTAYANRDMAKHTGSANRLILPDGRDVSGSGIAGTAPSDAPPGAGGPPPVLAVLLRALAVRLPVRVLRSFPRIAPTTSSTTENEVGDHVSSYWKCRDDHVVAGRDGVLGRQGWWPECEQLFARHRPGALGSTWADAGKMPDLFSGMWMTFSGMVEGDEKLNVPYTAKAQKFVDAYKPKRDIPYAEEGCQSPGLPIAMRTGPIKFTYAPGLISIYMQAVGHTRFIRMNEKQGKTSPKYYGNSVGHWEGDTLVVETADFLPEITFQYGVGKGLPPEGTIGTAGLPARSSRRWSSRRWSSRRCLSRWSSWRSGWSRSSASRLRSSRRGSRWCRSWRSGSSVEGHLGTAW